MKENTALVEIESESSRQTYAIGFAVGAKAGEGDIFALSGELGAGKTCFTGGLARGLGVSEDYTITSPTFTLINEYPGRCRLYHFDVYRLNQIGELDDLGYDEYVSGKGVVAIEWAEKIADALPTGAIVINFTYIDENKRVISISGPQKRVREIVKDIKTEV
ncbi:MAG: tRNA (adenosine(37)-N6)-threonylcarbamoyltransferase complex ATPase subunit type 1 TsaE [Deltaproteobacteria bacterium HGW-Deltaproteobacteria-7]|jgi:tRNA threonylcarbamoyladenosine biosynthesis protein TsaE|nr:MAG: tRNA (adenosine(37)-N6)-threonylcarbamoyltransferase complex ATPase subunit type 1 TsaE [Deltaproteobacteria bacterium HGW-Deltaproteobacteria-7]PKN20657.1 MAG: tRNA (adenosine(37)-N6)-threonylcarbamoyltransferase complex ATPase subunit type 1 TsaE [Deltaproteobacteria bacterium HGW-Deltaproteobacteria-6]